MVLGPASMRPDFLFSWKKMYFCFFYGYSTGLLLNSDSDYQYIFPNSLKFGTFLAPNNLYTTYYTYEKYYWAIFLSKTYFWGKNLIFGVKNWFWGLKLIFLEKNVAGDFFCINSIISIHKVLSVMYQLILKHQICWAQNWFLGLKIKFLGQKLIFGAQNLNFAWIHSFMYVKCQIQWKNLRYLEIHPKWTIHVGYSWKCVLTTIHINITALVVFLHLSYMKR